MKRFWMMVMLCCILVGCGEDNDNNGNGEETVGETQKLEQTPTPAGTPTFVCRISEYPSWSHYLVADAWGLIDKRRGYQGEYERKHGIDIELSSVDYDTCITEFGTGTCDATCLTNIDVLKPSTARAAVAILPSSTSNGADAAIVVGINSIEDLKGTPTRGLEDSVAQYCFERNLEVKQLKKEDFPFLQQDPGAAAQAMMQGQEGYNSIQVWNPFVLTVLEKRDGSKVLFDSTAIPEEIIDMVVVGQDVLAKEKGRAFAQCLTDVYYATCKYYGPALGEDLLTVEEAEEVASSLTPDQSKSVVALSKLAGFELPGPDMVRALRMTRFYYQPEDGIELFNGKRFQAVTMSADGPVDRFCKRNIDGYTTPSISFEATTAQKPFALVFDSTFMLNAMDNE